MQLKIFHKPPSPGVRIAAWVLLLAGFLTVGCQPLISTDVAWHLLAAREWLHGAEIYVDIRDPNLPATWVLFRAVVWLAEAIGVPAHRVFYLLVATAGIGISCLTHHLLPASSVGDRWRRTATVLSIGAYFGFASLYMSGQRDYDVALALLPYAAWSSRLTMGPAGCKGWGAVATLLALLALHLKPHYLAAILLLELWVIWRRRILWSWVRWDLLLPSLFVVGLVAAQIAVFPEYGAYLDRWLPFYTADQPSFVISARTYAALGLAGVVAFAVAVYRERCSAWSHALALLAVAACVACWLQGKWWDYQAYPIEIYAQAASCLIGIDIWLSRQSLGLRQRTVAIGLAVPAIAWALWTAALTANLQKFHTIDRPANERWVEITAAIDRLAAGKPVALFGTHDATVVVYNSKARWALADISMWVDGYVSESWVRGEAFSPSVDKAAAMHLEDLAARLEQELPAVIGFSVGLPDRPSTCERFYRSSPSIDALLRQRYELVEIVWDYRLFQRVH